MDYTLIATEVAKLLIGGIIGIFATSYYKDFKAKKNEQKSLFIRMVLAKSYIKIPQHLINDMNIIEILFRRHKKVLEKYHSYYEDLSLPADRIEAIRQRSLYLDLLREIGNVVGYRNLDNKTLDSRYIPNASLDELNSQQEFQSELLKYLKSGNELQMRLIEIYNHPEVVAKLSGTQIEAGLQPEPK